MAKTTIFSQIIKEIPRGVFESEVKRLGADKGTRTLNSWTWFGALLFSQLSGHDSIRALERLFAQGSAGEMKRLGFGVVKKSTLADANHKRPVELLEKVFSYLLSQVKSLPRDKFFSFKGEILALDATFIRLCLSLCPWATYRKCVQGSRRGTTMKSAGLKLHAAIDLAGDIPDFVILKHGSEKENGDLKVARENFKFNAGSTVIMDRGYWDLGWFQKLTTEEVFFVTRLARRVKFGVHKSHPVNRTQGLMCDQEVYLKTLKSKKKFKGLLRRVKYREPDTGKVFIFITNRFDLPPEVICDLYKARWRIEIFFKTLKQNLKIKKFLGFSPQAVRAQIWTALIAYLLIKQIRFTLRRSSISMSETVSVIATLLLLKLPLSAILADLPNTRAHSPPLQMLFNF